MHKGDSELLTSQQLHTSCADAATPTPHCGFVSRPSFMKWSESSIKKRRVQARRGSRGTTRTGSCSGVRRPWAGHFVVATEQAAAALLPPGGPGLSAEPSTKTVTAAGLEGGGETRVECRLQPASGKRTPFGGRNLDQARPMRRWYCTHTPRAAAF